MKTHLQFLTAIFLLKAIYLRNPLGVTDSEAAALLKVSPAQIARYRKYMTLREVTKRRYTATPLDIEMDFAQAVMWRAKVEEAHRE